MSEPAEAWSAAEGAAREAYGRLVALLAGRSGDIAGAEDALSEGLVAALERWPAQGVPANPLAWLLTVARRRGIDEGRRRGRAQSAQSEILRMCEEAEAAAGEAEPFPDRRLGLMLACAHPAIDPGARTPLMLQAVLGLSAERMASAFLASPAAMTKRLVRAKAKLALAGVGFELPDADVLPERLEPVLDAIYAGFTLGSDTSPEQKNGVEALEGEAIWLGRLLRDLAPEEPEAAGLLSLMLFVSARHGARGGRGDESFTPLSEQDPASWDHDRLTEAEDLLRDAGHRGRPGRFQVEAAIQAVHADRRRSGRTDWASVIQLYNLLISLAPTTGALIARSAAMAQAGYPASALEELDRIDGPRVAAHQPYWATRAYILAVVGRTGEAADAYRRAAGLTQSPGVRNWLLERRAALG